MLFEHSLLILAGILLGYSWLSHSKGNDRLAITLLMIGGVLLRYYMASDEYLHAWDERYHGLVAKNMIDNPFKPMLYKNPILGVEIFDWTHNHIWLHKQPMPLWTMAISLKLFGISEFSLRLPSLILSTVSIWLVYDLGKRMFNKKVAFFASFLFAVQGLVLEIGSGRIATDHIDLFFLFFILLAVWSAKVYSDKKKLLFNVLCGFAIGLAILTKWLPALIVLPLWGLFQLSNDGFNIRKILPRFLILLTIILLVSAPWQIYIWSVFPIEQGWESSFNIKHVTETLDGMGGPFYYHFDKMRMVYGELVYIPFIWFIYHSFKNKKNDNWVLLIWILIPYVFFSFTRTKMQAYTLFTAPALLIVCGVFWTHIMGLYKEKKFRPFVVILMIGLIVLPVRYSIERIKPFDSLDKSPKWASDLRLFDENVIKGDKNVLFNVNNNIESMFYTNVTAYEYIPNSFIIDSLLNEGYTVYINLSAGMDSIKGVKNIQLSQPDYK